jgi:carbamoyltransferase
VLIVGFNAYHGGVAAAAIDDGRLVAAVEEERFSRIKHAAGFPATAIRACLARAGATSSDVDRWAVARGRRVHLARKLWFAATSRPRRVLARQYAANQARHAAIPETLAAAVGVPVDTVRSRLRWVEHHPAHLASAYFTSGAGEAACCAIDGFGDFVSVSTAHGHGCHLDVVDRVYFPHSLGLMYLAITQHLGFKKYGDEYKVMGLAPYGTPRFTSLLSRLVRLTENGGFRLSLEYFRHWTGEIAMSWEAGEPNVPDVYSDRLVELIGPAREATDPLTRRHEDLAASIQHLFEECLWHVLNGVRARVPLDVLCLAGGCAMNSVANGRIRRQTGFGRVFVQPAAGDNGTALGAALHVWYAEGRGSAPMAMTHAYWGTEYDDEAIARAIRSSRAIDEGRWDWTTADNEEALCRDAAQALADGAIVGWFQGRMEWGARALGNRSILADPRRADMRELINRKIKFRERFRPFAPSVLAEAVGEYFVDAAPDPFMSQVYPVSPARRAIIPAVTHVDGSGRLQSVSRESNPRFWALIRAFAALTGVPVLLNTSFNENEPIVERPEQAIDCFARTEMDVLVMGSHLLRKQRV